MYQETKGNTCYEEMLWPKEAYELDEIDKCKYWGNSKATQDYGLQRTANSNPLLTKLSSSDTILPIRCDLAGNCMFL